MSEITNSFGESGYQHSVLLRKLDNKSYTYYVICYKEEKESAVKTITFTVDTSPVATPIVDDTSTIDKYPEYSYLTDEIRVKWQLPEKKPYPDYYTYYYMLEDKLGNITINWTESDKENKWIRIKKDHNGDKLNLTNGEKYLFSVIAENKAGSSSEIGKSDGVIIDISKKPVECDDGIQNGDETDIDCGGSCDKCDLTNKEGWTNQLGHPQYSEAEIELWLDESNPIYKAEELFRKVSVYTASMVYAIDNFESPVRGKVL